MTQWEYRVAPLKEAAKLKKDADELAPDRLNELGAEGWEAVGVTLKRGTSWRGPSCCSSAHYRISRPDRRVKECPWQR